MVRQNDILLVDLQFDRYELLSLILKGAKET